MATIHSGDRTKELSLDQERILNQQGLIYPADTHAESCGDVYVICGGHSWEDVDATLNSIAIIAGAMRLKTQLDVLGKATMSDFATGDSFIAHVVGKRVVHLENGCVAAQKAAIAAIQLSIRVGQSGYAKQLLAAPKNKPFYRQFDKRKF